MGTVEKGEGKVRVEIGKEGMRGDGGEGEGGYGEGGDWEEWR